MSIRIVLSVFIFALLTLSANVTIAQQISTHVERELERFPWYESGKLKDLPRLEPGRAQSLERGKVPKRSKIKPKNSNSNATTTPLPQQVPLSDSFLQTTVFVVLMIGVIFLVAIFLWLFFKTDFLSTNDGKKKLDEEAFDLQTRINQLPFRLDEETITGDFDELALAAAKRSDFAKAIMLLFSHILLGLDRQGLVQLKKGKTNRQYLRDLRNFQTLAQYFEKVMIPFEDSFFGDHRIEEHRFYECLDGLRQFQGELELVAKTEVL